MKVNVVGNGGREHALRVVLGRTSTIVDDASEADLVVIGPEAPLVAGLADKLRADGKVVFGPGHEGAQLEGSKQWMKEFAERAGLPTARYGSFDDPASAIAFMKTLPPPYVIKTNGLAAGKGVLVTDSFDDAVADIHDKLSGTSFGDAGRRVVIEEGMTGPEVSIMYLFDGKKGVALPPAQDFKRAYDDDKGPNTGGMGAYSDVPIVTPKVFDEIVDRILEPTAGRLRREEIDYRGVLYAGLMLTPDGPKLVEYNVRFGDPEAQVILPRLAGDVAETLMSVARGSLDVDGQSAVEDKAVTVGLASAGYPTNSRSGDIVEGLDEAEALPNIFVFRSGVTTDADGVTTTTGGRALNVTALAPTLAEARERAYDAVKRIHFDGMLLRTDIALKASADS